MRLSDIADPQESDYYFSGSPSSDSHGWAGFGLVAHAVVDEIGGAATAVTADTIVNGIGTSAPSPSSEFSGDNWNDATVWGPDDGGAAQNVPVDPVSVPDGTETARAYGQGPTADITTVVVTAKRDTNDTNGGVQVASTATVPSWAWKAAGAEEVLGGGPEDPVADAVAGLTIGIGIGAAILNNDKTPTPESVGPGPNAGPSVPAGPSDTPTKEQQEQINQAGQQSGCHTCGTTNPGTKSGNWVGDHQPPTALNPSGGAQVYYPQCLACSNRQGGLVRGIQQQQGDPQ